MISKDLNHLIKPIGLIITIDIIIWTIFDKWLWKLRIFHSWLVKIPDLNGIWIGTYETKYKTSKIRLEIIQTLTIIGCKIDTENGVSVGYATNILYEPEKHQKKLIISYNYELQSNKENKEHRGTYDLIIDEQNKLLKGSYWTNKRNFSFSIKY